MSNNLPSYLIISTDINRDLSNAIQDILPDKIAVLVDENTKKYCLQKIDLAPDLLIEIKSGENEKNLKTCEYIWEQLTTNGFTRKSLLINLGGGVIGDMGGFVAATFKRGMAFFNIPTTLLSQVDASIGGKLGVDFLGLKNHIGLFQEPNKVIVHTPFLETLSEREMKSGFAEIIKHALISDESHWHFLQKRPFSSLDWGEVIPKSISIKNEVAKADPREGGFRKILNYGHTIGHALESHFLSSPTPLTHGEAVALGMILENQVAIKKGMLVAKEGEEINSFIRNIYDLPKEIPNYELLKDHLLQDKKNDALGIRFSLLEKIGTCVHDVLIEEQILKEVLK